MNLFLYATTQLFNVKSANTESCLLHGACTSDCEWASINGGPTRSSGGPSLISDPPDIRTGVGKYIDGALKLLNHREPFCEIICHVCCICTLCSIKPNFANTPISTKYFKKTKPHLMQISHLIKSSINNRHLLKENATKIPSKANFLHKNFFKALTFWEALVVEPSSTHCKASHGHIFYRADPTARGKARRRRHGP